MRVLKLTLAYDGTDYAGWQIQPNGPTIQEQLENAIESVTQCKVRVTASGRTDAGVHAFGQVASFQIDCEMEAGDLLRAINATTPVDISVYGIEEVSSSFHPIADATRKRYRYVIQDGQYLDVFQRGYAWHIHTPLDVAKMQEGAEHLKGTHDFVSFQATGSERESTTRTIFDLPIIEQDVNDHHQIVIEVEGDGFLYNMVRNIVGTLVDVGKEKQAPIWIDEVLKKKDRRVAGMTAPAHGLFLVSVQY